MRTIYQVDAFTREPFHGNPAGVCLLDDLDDAEWMRGVAAGMNVSETAFLTRAQDGYRIRRSTPCGTIG
ncbi:MAG: PhzF family phenazine biosynthesis protein [Actinocatenispora sp.]